MIIMTKIPQIVHKYPPCCSVRLGKIRLIAGNYEDKQRKNDKYGIAYYNTQLVHVSIPVLLPVYCLYILL